MYTGNLILDITCDRKTLAHVIEFGVKCQYCHGMFTRNLNRVMPAHQITPDARYYALGAGTMRPGGHHNNPLPPKDGWQDEKAEYDCEYIADTVWNWVTLRGTIPDDKAAVRVRSLHMVKKDPDSPDPQLRNPDSAILIFEPVCLKFRKD